MRGILPILRSMRATRTFHLTLPSSPADSTSSRIDPLLSPHLASLYWPVLRSPLSQIVFFSFLFPFTGCPSDVDCRHQYQYHPTTYSVQTTGRDVRRTHPGNIFIAFLPGYNLRCPSCQLHVLGMNSPDTHIFLSI
ncbi:hypothetical protein LY78DRAFT_217845 [Colletotrichum sublineola]|nr:hypothetical protein LY78DRAFT_217845 [Colletotrichum sublineola]